MNDTTRLWVPGVCVVGGGGVLQAGPLVGWRYPRGIEDWKREVTVCEKSRCNSQIKSKGHIVFPEERIDAQRFPHLHTVATRCPVIALPENATVGASDLRVLEVMWHRVSNGGSILMRGGGEETLGYGGEFPGMYRIEAMTPDEAASVVRYRASTWDTDFPDDEQFNQEVELLVAGRGHELEDWHRLRPTVARLITSISDGRISEEAVELATDLLDVLGDETAMAHWETWLVRVLEQAEPLRSDAEAIVRAMEQASGEAEVYELEVPVFDKIKRVVLPALRMADTDAETEEYPIRLPAEVVFVVHPAPSGEAWALLGCHVPMSPRTLPGRLPAKVPWVAVVVLTVAVVVAWFALR